MNKSNLSRRALNLRSTAIAAVMSFLTLGALPAGATSVTVGNFDGPNCFPFSCLAGGSGSRYQQVYSSAAFVGPISINSISFFQDVGGLMDSASYDISFSTTSAAVGALDLTFADNVGGDSQAFGTFTLGGNMPPVLTFSGTTFAYDPSKGNLLMNVDVYGLTQSFVESSSAQADYTGTDTRRIFGFYNLPDADSTYSDQLGALRTEFNISPIPEPETYALMLAGLAVVGAAAKRRRKNT